MASDRNILASVIAVAIAMVQAQSALAQPEAEADAAHGTAHSTLSSAKKRFEAGKAKFTAGDYTGALADFRTANEVKSTPQAERFIGRCLDSLGRYREAIEWYDKFLAHVPRTMSAEGTFILDREAAIMAMPGKVHVESNPPGAAVSIDGKVQNLSTPADVELAPGQHNVKLSAPGRASSEKSIDVAFASRQALAADLPPTAPAAADGDAPPPVELPESAPPEEAPPSPAARASRIALYATAGLSVASAGVGTAFGILALNDKSHFEQQPTPDNARARNTHALIADTAFGAAVVLGVTSVILLVRKDQSSSTAAANTVSSSYAPPQPRAESTRLTLGAAPWMGVDGAGAALFGQF